MPLARIDENEQYPFYTFGEYGYSVEVTEELLERYQRVMDEFWSLQDELGDIHDLASAPLPPKKTSPIPPQN